MEEILYMNKQLGYFKNKGVYDLPKSMIFCGRKGSGRHLLCRYVSDHYGMNVKECVPDIDIINDSYKNLQMTHYIIDYDSLRKNNIEALLKFVEEPGDNTHITILTTDARNVEDTIWNRCIVMYMPNYTREQLFSFIDVFDEETDTKTSLCRTPGEVLHMTSNYIRDMRNLSDLIIDKISIASVPNTMTLTDKVLLYKDIPTEMFFRILKEHLTDRVIKFDYTKSDVRDGNKYVKAYNKATEIQKELEENNYNKEYLLDNFFLTMKEIFV